MEDLLDHISQEIYSNSYVVVDNFIDEDFRKALLKEQTDLLNQGQFKKAAVGQGNQKQVGAGSGVIIGSDGYIVTNNHVIAGADNIYVTTNNNKTYSATVIGNDPGTDIALLKIEENLNDENIEDAD